jgi:transcriptional regulator
MYWTGKPEMKIKKKDFSSSLKVIVNGSTNVLPHSVDTDKAEQVEHWLARLSYQNESPYVLQNELYEMKVLKNEFYLPTLITTLKQLHGMTEISDRVFKKHLKNNMKVFFDIESWMNFISEFDIVIGTRFHGTLIGLLNNIPSILFTHDSRTREMAEVLSIPFIDVRNAENLDLKRLYEEADLVSLEVKYQYMYKHYIEFLNENKLEHILKSTK